MNTPSFLLIHGAWHGGWCWRDTARFLRDSGHHVLAPTLTGLGERAHLLSPEVGIETFIRDVTAVIDVEELEHVTLVGHSFGAVVSLGVAARRPQIVRQLIYLDGLCIDDGESPFHKLAPAVVEQRVELARRSSGGLTIPVPPPDLFGVTRVEDQAWLRRQLTPHPLKAFTDRLHLGGSLSSELRKTYIQCVDPPFPSLGISVERIRADTSWNFRELDTGHDAMVIAPNKTAEILVRAASAH